EHVDRPGGRGRVFGLVAVDAGRRAVLQERAHRQGRAVGRQRDAPAELVARAGVGGLDVRVHAGADGAVVVAAIAVRRVAVVALLGAGDDAVAARRHRAVLVAAVAALEVAVVAALAGLDLAVAAPGLARGRPGAGRIVAVGQAVAVLVAQGRAVL